MKEAELVYEKALALLGGPVEAGREAALREMCTTAWREILGRLRPEVDAAAEQETLVRGAAMLALALFLQFEDSFSSGSSYKVGNVSVSRRGQGSMRNAANGLRRQAESLLAGLLTDSGFVFLGVRG